MDLKLCCVVKKLRPKCKADKWRTQKTTPKKTNKQKPQPLLLSKFIPLHLANNAYVQVSGGHSFSHSVKDQSTW